MLLAALACAACGGKDLEGDFYNLKHYGSVKPLNFEFEGNTWGVFDKPEEGRMLVVSLGAHGSMGEELIERTEEAARGYLGHTSRACEIEARELASATDNSIEFIYSCSD